MQQENLQVNEQVQERVKTYLKHLLLDRLWQFLGGRLVEGLGLFKAFLFVLLVLGSLRAWASN